VRAAASYQVAINRISSPFGLSPSTLLRTGLSKPILSFAEGPFDKLRSFDKLTMHGPFDKLRPFGRLTMHGPFDKLRANGMGS
jgi:hypothetical protein